MPSLFKNVTILLPAMDETYSLRQTVDAIIETNTKEDIAEFILLLCEGTTLECRVNAEELVKKYKSSISIYIHNQTLPFAGGAIREGISLAKGSHVVMMSSDLETDPCLIKDFIVLAKEHPNHIITATRWKKGGGFEQYNKIKLVCNLIFERAIGLFYLTRLTDLTYGFRLFPTDLMKSIRWEELKHPFYLETCLKPALLGAKFHEIPGKFEARSEGESQNSFWQTFRYIPPAIRWRFYKRDRLLKE